MTPTSATITSTMEPVLAGVGAFALFREFLSGAQILGRVLLIAAILVVRSGDRSTAVMPPGE